MPFEFPLSNWNEKVLAVLKAIADNGGGGGGGGGGTIAAGENHIGEVGGRTSTAIADLITRPANATTYTGGSQLSINEAVPKILTFANAARIIAGSGYLIGAKLGISGTNSNLSCRLWLYNSLPTALADQSAFTLLEADFNSRIGYVDFASFVNGGSGSNCVESYATAVNLPFSAAAGSQNLYGQLIFTGSSSYSPSSGQRFRVSLLGVEQN